MPPAPANRDEPCRQVLAYLSATDPAPPAAADAVIGFGMFDLGLPRFCGELYLRGLARRIVFTGGIGAGTGNLGGPEAVAWRRELRRAFPQIPDEHVIIESRSTNTAENIAFSGDLLRREHPELAFGRGLRRVLVVASPSRLRRVWLTLKKHLPELETCRQLPAAASLDRERRLYAENGVDYADHLAGELERIASYPGRGWIAAETLPEEISAARDRLRAVQTNL